MTRLAPLLAALLLAACSDVVPEDGTKPVALELNLGGTTGLATLNECILSQATALLYFDGNLGLSSGDFSSRVLWSSSDPGVVEVSNGELPAASGGGYYAAGVLVPHRTGVVQVSASYLDFVASITLEVQPVLLSLEPELTDIAERSHQAFELNITTASGLSVSAAEGVSWNLDQAVSNANVDASGLLSANSAGEGRFTLRAQPVGCDRSATQSLKVSTIDHLELEREQPEAALPVGISDLLRVQAHFAGSGSLPQNLSSQMEYEADDDEIIGLATVGDALKLSALEAGSSGGVARFEPDQGSSYSIRLPDYTVQELDIGSLRLNPQELRLVYPATGELTAWAGFEDGIERPVSRHVSWSSSDSTLIAVVTGGESFGSVQIANSDYSGQAYAAFGGYTAAAGVLVYRNEGP
ncbi:MAG: hypothetical protein Q8Q73_01525 [Stagnimonas sp.]|nr:hypothetical protein [Stagnimonas sp.]